MLHLAYVQDTVNAGKVKGRRRGRERAGTALQTVTLLDALANLRVGAALGRRALPRLPALLTGRLAVHPARADRDSVALLRPPAGGLRAAGDAALPHQVPGTAPAGIGDGPACALPHDPPNEQYRGSGNDPWRRREDAGGAEPAFGPGGGDDARLAGRGLSGVEHDRGRAGGPERPQGSRGLVSGLSGSGKSTIGAIVEGRLLEEGVQTMLLDGRSNGRGGGRTPRCGSARPS